MASRFFHVHHEFRAGKAQQWWESAQAAMAPGGGWDDAVAQNLEAGFFNHAFCPVGPEGPAFCIWEVREGITDEEFQDFIDGPNGVNFGLDAWMNICREINVELAGKPPYTRKFLILCCGISGKRLNQAVFIDDSSLDIGQRQKCFHRCQRP